MKREKNPNQRAFKIVTKKQIVISKPTEEPIPEIATGGSVIFGDGQSIEATAQELAKIVRGD